MSQINPDRWHAVETLVDQLCETDQIPAVGLQVLAGDSTRTYFKGRSRIQDQDVTLRDDAIFLVASITKPIVALGVLKLLEAGELLLNDRVKRFVPEFGCAGKHGITLRHLMTHTSGLPDMLPTNRKLRSANAPLSEFVEQSCRLTPTDPPGRNVSYSSTAFAILAEVIQRVSGQTCAEFLKQTLFDPLQMFDTSLGVPDSWNSGELSRLDRIAEIRVPAEYDVEPHWDWNSPYWRGLGSPWGGLFTTPGDLARLVTMLMQQGRSQQQQFFSFRTLEEATRNQLGLIPGLPELTQQGKGWGLGWQIVSAANSDYYGDLLSDTAYGHAGATGTLVWIDPRFQAAAIILTTQPQEPHGRFLARISNTIVTTIDR